MIYYVGSRDENCRFSNTILVIFKENKIARDPIYIYDRSIIGAKWINKKITFVKSITRLQIKYRFFPSPPSLIRHSRHIRFTIVSLKQLLKKTVEKHWPFLVIEIRSTWQRNYERIKFFPPSPLSHDFSICIDWSDPERQRDTGIIRSVCIDSAATDQRTRETKRGEERGGKGAWFHEWMERIDLSRVRE